MSRLEPLRAHLDDGGVAVLPTDTVYGLAASLASEAGVEALYRLKGRDRAQPCQVLLLGAAARERAMAAMSPPERVAAAALLPGPATCIVGDAAGAYARAAGEAAGSVGIRAPAMTGELERLEIPLVATSANDPGGPDPRVVADVPERFRAVAHVWDGGRLPGVASAVVDLRALPAGGPARLVREGPDRPAVATALARVGVELL